MKPCAKIHEACVVLKTYVMELQTQNFGIDEQSTALRRNQWPYDAIVFIQTSKSACAVTQNLMPQYNPIFI